MALKTDDKFDLSEDGSADDLLAKLPSTTRNQVAKVIFELEKAIIEVYKRNPIDSWAKKTIEKIDALKFLLGVTRRKTIKVLINRAKFGSLHFSEEGLRRLKEVGIDGNKINEYANGKSWMYKGEEIRNPDYKLRADTRVIDLFKEMGDSMQFKAHYQSDYGNNTSLCVVEVPEDVDWYIDQEGCGEEFVVERHRTWGEHGFKRIYYKNGEKIELTDNDRR